MKRTSGWIWLLLTLALACTSPVPPAAERGIVWEQVAAERVPVLVTRDPDGDERATRLWLVVVDHHGYVRTGDSHWFRNIQRDPRVQLRIGGETHRLHAEPVMDPVLRIYVEDAFRRKYGMGDWLVDPFRPDTPNVLRLTPRP